MKKSFTLIELLIVIAIIAIIATGIIVLIIPGERLAQARDATRASHLKAIEGAFYIYIVNYGGTPSNQILENEFIEICNTNTENYDCTDLIDLSDLNISIPVDPMGSDSEHGTGYYIAWVNNEISIYAAKSETKLISTGSLKKDWWDSRWLSKKIITIDHTKIDEDLTDFPVLVNLTIDNFDFSKSLSNGFDIRFISFSEETELKYERERYDDKAVVAEYGLFEDLAKTEQDFNNLSSTFYSTSNNFNYDVDTATYYSENAAGRLRTMGTGTSGYGEIVFENIDLTNVDALSFYFKGNNMRGTWGYPSVFVGDNEVWYVEKNDNGDQNYDWQEIIINVSGYTGTKDIKFRLTSPNGTGVSSRYFWFDNVKLLEILEEDGKAEYWVKIPFISSTEDTQFYMYYNNSNAVDGADPIEVWDNNFKGVWHFTEQSGNRKDSTVNENHGAISGYPTSTEGSIGSAIDFDTSDKLNLSNTINLDGDFTISYWFKTNRATNWRIVNNAASFNHSFGYANASRISFWNPTLNIDLSESFVVGEWEKATVVRLNNELKIYRFGNEIGSSGWTGEPHLNQIAGTPDNSSWTGYSGSIDEMRVSDVARSAAWIKANYHSENNTLLLFGD